MAILTFLNYLHGSELLFSNCAFASEFLNYLHGSEHKVLFIDDDPQFLNYLHGSEQYVGAGRRFKHF